MFSKAEREYLKGEKPVLWHYERILRFRIKQKAQKALKDLELLNDLILGEGPAWLLSEGYVLVDYNHPGDRIEP